MNKILAAFLLLVMVRGTSLGDVEPASSEEVEAEESGVQEINTEQIEVQDPVEPEEVKVQVTENEEVPEEPTEESTGDDNSEEIEEEEEEEESEARSLLYAAQGFCEWGFCADECRLLNTWGRTACCYYKPWNTGCTTPHFGYDHSHNGFGDHGSPGSYYTYPLTLIDYANQAQAYQNAINAPTVVPVTPTYAVNPTYQNQAYANVNLDHSHLHTKYGSSSNVNATLAG